MFPGQASQYVGMGRYWFNQYEIVRQRMREASEIIGFDLSDLCFNGPAKELRQTENTQVALLTVGVAIFEALKENEGIIPSYIAGHSIGELSALTASGVFSFVDGVKLARIRGKAMASCDTGTSSGMYAVTKIKSSLVEALINEMDPKGEGVQVANYNSPTQTVLSGTIESLKVVGKQLSALGASVIPLNVSGPFHSRFMGSAAESLEDALELIEIGTMDIPVICGHEGRFYTEQDDIKQALVAQLTAPVRWTTVLSQLDKESVDHWLEIGPGTVLKNLTHQMLPGVEIASLDEVDNYEKQLKLLDILREEKDRPNLIGLCLGAAVSTRNTNWDNSSYEQGVVKPYKQIQGIYEKVDAEKRLPEKEEMSLALSLLKEIFVTKGTSNQEQKQRIQHIIKSTGTESIFPEYISVEGEES